MSPLQPVDGLMAVVQRHDEDISGHHVLTLDEAIERFEGTNLIGDLKHCKTVLDRRAMEDRFQTSDHLVIINPVATQTFHMEVILRMLAACLKFEEEWKAFMGCRYHSTARFGAQCCLVLFVRVQNHNHLHHAGHWTGQQKQANYAGEIWPFPYRTARHSVPCPNSLNPTATTRAPATLIALLLAESKKVNTTDFSDFDPFDTTINLEPTQHGLLKKEIQFFIQEEFVTELDLSAGVVEQFDRTVRDYLLVEQGLLKVRHHRKRRITHTIFTHLPGSIRR